MKVLDIDCNIKASILYLNTEYKSNIFSTWKEYGLQPRKLHDHTRGEVYVFKDRTVIRVGGSHENTIRAFSTEKSSSIIRLFSKEK